MKMSRLGFCHLATRVQNKDNSNTPKKGLTPGSIYIICLDSTPKHPDPDSCFSVAFFVDGVVRNDLIYCTKFLPKFAIPYFFLEDKYQLFVEGGHYISCVVQIGDELWVSEKHRLRLSHDVLKSSLAKDKKGVSLDNISKLNGTVQVYDLFTRLGLLDHTIDHFTNDYQKPRTKKRSRNDAPPMLTITDAQCSSSPEIVTSTLNAHCASQPEIVLSEISTCNTQCSSSSEILTEFSISKTSNTRCINERTKFFKANFEDDTETGMSYIQYTYLTKFRDLLNQISNIQFSLTHEQAARLNSLGYVPNDRNLYLYTYLTGCICDYCSQMPIANQYAMLMISFAFPIDGSELYQQLVDLWSWSDVFCHPILNYKSIFHLSPSIEDSKYGYTIFNISLCSYRKPSLKLDVQRIMSNLIYNINKILCWYDSHPEIASITAFNNWLSNA